jgi:hypothetical protein
MSVYLKIFFSVLFPLCSFSQTASISKCWRYEIKCSHDSHLNHSVTAVKNQPDTSWQLSIDEVLKLNNFLAANKSCHTEEDPERGFDIRVVYLFADENGKRHELGFDCDGNYELDGISYPFNKNIAGAFSELKIGNQGN